MPGRIVSAVDSNPNKRGPVELGLLATAQEWIRRGGEYALAYTAEPPPWYAEMLRRADIQCTTLDPSHWNRDVLSLAESTKADLVHLHFGRHLMAEGLVAGGSKVIRTEHSFRAPARLDFARRVVRHRRQRHLSLFVAVSEYIADQVQRDFLVSRDRVTVVFNGVDLQRFSPRPQEKADLRRTLLGLRDDHIVITCAAYLSHHKRQDLLLAALPMVLADYPQVRVVIAGDGPSRDSLHALADGLGIADRVRFLHGDNDVAALYAASDIGVLLSQGEGLPSSAIEALASGLPLVATPNGGLAEVYRDGESGLSVQDPTPDAVAEALARLVGDVGLRTRMAHHARARAEQHFSMAAHASGLCRVYEAVLSGNL